MSPKPSSEDDDNGNGGPVSAIQPGDGSNPFDPSKNVGDLVKAESKKRDELRAADKELVDVKIEALKDRLASDDRLRSFETKLQDWMRDAESKRLDQLAAIRQVYETRIADMLRTSVESTSSLVSTQLVQIQNTFNERVSQLEKFRWESGGKTSVSDPALADALARLSSGMSGMQTGFADALAKLTSGQAEVTAKIAASVGGLMADSQKAAGEKSGSSSTWAMIGGLIFLGVTVLGGIGAMLAQ